MNLIRRSSMLSIVLVASLCGCGAKTVDMSQIHKPARPAELDAYNVFVGKWDWKAEMLNADAAHRNWSGTAEWEWALDQRGLHGHMVSTGGDISFESAGLWSVNPKSKKYVWWMFNNWGYMQNGKAKYNADCKTWKMPFKSTGLDGTASEGYYTITVVDSNNLNWELHEWAMMHMAKKIEMKGTYTRKP